MAQYRTISLQVVKDERGECIEVYDFMNHATAVHKELRTIGDAIDKYNQRGYYVTAVDRIDIDPLRENRIILMTKEGRE